MKFPHTKRNVFLIAIVSLLLACPQISYSLEENEPRNNENKEREIIRFAGYKELKIYKKTGSEPRELVTQYTYNSKGLIIECKDTDPDYYTDQLKNIKYKYNDKDLLVEEVLYIENELSYKYVYSYNDKGLLTQEYYTEYYNGKKKSETKITYKYNNKSLLVERPPIGLRATIKNNGIESDYSTKFIYNNNNNLIEEQYFYNNELNRRHVYKYNNKNQLIEETKYDNNNSKYDVTVYKYDDRGLKIEGQDYWFGKQGDIYKYKYNNFGLLIEEVLYYSGSKVTVIYTYEYK